MKHVNRRQSKRYARMWRYGLSPTDLVYVPDPACSKDTIDVMVDEIGDRIYVHGVAGCRFSVDDMADRPARASSDGDILDLGGRRVRSIDSGRSRSFVGMD